MGLYILVFPVCYTVDYLIMHRLGSQLGLCIIRSYALLDVSQFVTFCDFVTLNFLYFYLLDSV
jgi:hypothetical protein